MEQIDYKKKYEEAIERLKQYDREHSSGYSIKERDEFIFPELRESDDEKIRKDIISLVIKWWKDNGAVEPEFSTQNSMIAWLEKQCEQNATKDYSTLEITDVVRQALQECESFRNIRTEVYAAMVGATVENIIKKQGEQKPVDKVEPKFKVGDKIEYIGDRKELTAVDYVIQEVRSDSYYCKNGSLIPFKFQNEFRLVGEQKSAEWSEEDETNIGRAIDIIKDAKEGLLSYKTDDGIYECEQAIKVLDKLLKNGYSVLWKETDYDNIEKLIKILPQCIFRHPHILERDECLKLVSWLKSLRPQKQDVMSVDEFRHVVCYLVQDIVANEHMVVTEKQPINFFVEKYYKKLRTQSYWKPSDEQMVVLNDIIINGHLSNANERILKGLQEQLKAQKGE